MRTYTTVYCISIELSSGLKAACSKVGRFRPLSEMNRGTVTFDPYHVDIKLIQAAEWGLGDGPEGEHEAHGGEGALPAGQRPHVTQLRLVSLPRLHLDTLKGGREGGRERTRGWY